MVESATAAILSRAATRESWGPVVAASIVAHALLVTGVILMPAAGPDDEPRLVMAISLGGSPGPAGGLSAIGGRAVQQVAPQEAPRPRAEAPPAAKPPEMTLPSKEARTAPRPSTAPTRTPEARGQRPTTGEEVSEGSARADTGARGRGFGLTGGGGTGSGAYLDVGDFCCPEYLQAVVQAIQRNWNSKQNVTAKTLMQFTIERNGALTKVLVERPSGFVALDMAAQRALLLTQTVPELPAAFSNSTLTVHMWFEYQR
ncbi:MAG: TonB C-terminal domain-containing protein [Acidimicrobiia bacterium]|nr:TonB C-terminal domain-containing protein [Acidimicrobiia bacterium]